MRGRRRGIALPEMERLLEEGVVAGLPDRDLLERWVSHRDRSGELAFTALVARHGPMVLGVCRRILRDSSEADDAFQATFLVLARQAGSIRLGDSLGPWLYGVSRRVARRLQVVAARRRVRCGDEGWLESIPDRRAVRMSDLEGSHDLDAMLAALPDSFRAALRLCYFEGLTHEEAAARLGCPVGTVRSRLARGRALLRRRLEDSPPSRSPLVAPSLLHLTARTAVQFAAGLPLAGVAPARVATVTMGVVESMSRTKFIAATSLIITITGLASLAAWAGQSGRAERASPPVSENRIDAAFARPPVAVAQADSGTRRKSDTRDRKTDQKPIGDLPADFPAFVVETQPRLGDVEVDAAATKEIRIVFSKPMMDRSWSLSQGNVYAFPESRADALSRRSAHLRGTRQARAGQDVRDGDQWRAVQQLQGRRRKAGAAFQPGVSDPEGEMRKARREQGLRSKGGTDRRSTRVGASVRPILRFVDGLVRRASASVRDSSSTPRAWGTTAG